MKTYNKYRLAKSDLIIYCLILFYLTVSTYETLVGVNYAKYIRLTVILVILAIEILSILCDGLLVKDKKLITVFTVFLAFVAIAIFRNINITYIELMAVYLTCYFVFLQKEINIFSISNKLNCLILFFSIFYGGMIIIQWIYPDLINDLIFSRFEYDTRHYVSKMIERGSYSGIFTEVSTVCSYIVMGLGLSFYAIRNNKRKYLLCGFFLFVLLLTGKRAHLFFSILAIVIIYIFSTSGQDHIRRILKILLGGGLISVLLLIYIYNSSLTIFDRYKETITAISTGQDISTGRILIWKQALIMIAEKPAFGFGWGKCEEIISANLKSSVKLGAHNVWMQLWAETGISGMLLFTAFSFFSVIATFKTLRNYHNTEKKTCKTVLYISAYYQVFFLLYSLTGAPLYDRVYFIPYFIVVLFAFQIKTKLLRRKGNPVFTDL